MWRNHGSLKVAATVLLCIGASQRLAPGAETEAGKRAFLYANEFASSSMLTAAAKQTIVFEATFADVVSLVQLEAGEHRFCLDSSGEYFTGMVLEGSQSTAVAASLNHRGCTTADLPAGLFHLHLSHGADAPGAADVALVSIDRYGPLFLNSGGEPRKGYWAVIPSLPESRQEPATGRLRALLSQDGRMPVTGDFSSGHMDASSLWQFGANSPALLAAPNTVFDYETNSLARIAAGTVLVTQEPHNGPSIQVIEGWDRSSFQLRLKGQNGSPDVDLGFAPTFVSPYTLKLVRSSPYYRTPASFSLAFRFFLDAADIDPLLEGEAALFQASGYHGKAAVFSSSASSLAELNSDAATIDHSAVSIRLGPGTGAVLYSDPKYLGTAAPIQVDTPELLEAGKPASIRLTSLVIELLGSHRCVNCNFEGIDLSGLNLSGFDLTGARLVGSNLADAHLNGTHLIGADLTGATLSCTDFSGADSAHLNDLTRTSFTNAHFVQQASCRTDFSYTRLIVGALPPDNLTILKLTGARFERPRLARAAGSVPGPPLVDANGQPVGGYWAIQLYDGGGRVTVSLPFSFFINGDGVAYRWLVADPASQVMDEYSLFKFPGSAVPYGSFLAFPDTSVLNHTNNPMYPESPVDPLPFYYLAAGQGPVCTGCDIPAKMTIRDVGAYHFTWYVLDQPVDVSQCNDPGCPDGVAPNDYFLVERSSNGSLRLFTVAFRFFPDGTEIGDLAEGEVALYQQTGFKGKAAVFATRPDTYNLDIFTSDATTLPQTTQSFRLGNNTAVSWGQCSTGGCDWVGFIVDQASWPPDQNEHVLWVQPLDQAITEYIQSSNVPIGNPYRFHTSGTPRECKKCKLANAHFSGISFQGWDLSGAVLSGATLSNVTFGNVNLTGADLEGATLAGGKMDSSMQLANAKLAGTVLSCVDFSGSDRDHLSDWRAIDFSGVIWVSNDSCRNNLSYTKLSVTQFPPSIWKNFNLTGAVFVDLDPQLSSQAHPLDLSGAMLAGVSLQDVVLDYAVMTGADLTGTFLNHSSLQRATLANAKLYGAHLANVNLDGANLGGVFLTKPSSSGTAASLEGAYLRNVNLSQARLSGANFSNSSFYSTSPVGTGTCLPNSQGFTNDCATASGAVMDNTEFNGAYLYGTDFTSVTAEGVRFGNSFLAGANFASAALSADTSGADTGFSGTFLQGTNLATTTLRNGISLQGAFVDFTTSGNTIDLSLSGQHTNFPLFWSTPGKPVCAEMSYSTPTALPVTGPNDTCPNGNSYPMGCGPASVDGSNAAWKSPVDITEIASYQSKATYTNAPSNGQPFCAEDPRWKPFSLDHPASGTKGKGNAKPSKSLNGSNSNE